MRKLTPKEKEVMALLWAHGPMFIREMLAFYDEPKPHYNTVATIVKLLIEKGYVTYRAFGNTYQYSAKISEREYKGTTLGEFVAQFYENSYANVVSQFVEEEKIGLDDLKALIERIEKGKQ